MSSHEEPCPIWETTSNAVRMVDHYFIRDRIDPGEVRAGKHFMPCYSPRAGGHFKLNMPGAELLPDLTERQKANLSYWIYRHNHPSYLLFDALPEQEVDPPVLDAAWVKRHQDRTPSTSARVLTFLCELIRANNAGKSLKIPRSLLLPSAGGCRNEREVSELFQHTADQGWTTTPGMAGMVPFAISLSGRMHVEEQLGQLGQERQGFVARWFDCSMDPMYADGIEPAIWDAGYEPRLINDRGFTGGVVDQILAEIRKSKFIVADFTSCGKCTACKKCEHIGARGGVYFEAGFALGLGKTVFLTCRKDRKQAVHFDVNHLNRIEWETPEDLREDLKNSIEAVLGHGPLTSSNGDQEDVGSNPSLAA